MKNLIKGTLLFLMLAMPAQAAVRVTFSGNEFQPRVLIDAGGQELAVYMDDLDLWVVTRDSDAVELQGTRRDVGLVDTEKLSVTVGSGLRVRFDKVPPKITFNNTATTGNELSLLSMEDGVYLPSGDRRMVTAQSRDLNTIHAVIPRGGIVGQAKPEKIGNLFFPKTESGYRIVDYLGDLPSADIRSGMLVLSADDVRLFELVPVTELVPPTAPSATASAPEALGQVRAAIEKITGFKMPKRYVPKRVKAEIEKALPDMAPKFDYQYPTALPLRSRGKKNFLAAEVPQYEEDFDLDFDFEEDKGEEEVSLSTKTLIPYFGDDLYVYRDYHREYMREFLDADSYKSRNESRLKLAKLALAFGRPQEALTVIENMPKDKKSGFARSKHARFVAGVANYLMYRPEQTVLALEGVKAGGELEQDRKLWLAAAYEALDRDKESLRFFKKGIDASLPYPLYLQRELRLSYGRVLLRQERISALVNQMRELTELMTNKELPSEGALLLGRANVILNQDELAEELLATAASSEDPEIAFMAQYEFVDFLLNRGDITASQAITHLEDLRYLWRGGEMEENILFKLGRMYIDRGDHRQALDRLKYYTTYFYDSEKAEEGTEMMSDLFSDLFLDRVQTDMDSLALLGVYYDYRELTPPGKDGDSLIQRIGERLQNLGLFERAINVLERQLKYRTKEPENKARIGHDLAMLYHLNRQYDDGLNALVRTEGESMPQEIIDRRSLVQARLLMAQRKNVEAGKILKEMEGDEAEQMRTEIYWTEDQYPELVQNLKETYTGDDAIRFWTPEDETNFLRLAVAYHQTGDTENLEALKAHFPEKLLKKNLSTAVEMMLEDMDSEEADVPENPETEVEKVIAGIKGYNDFVDYYKSYKNFREEEKRERAIFNRRMRQVSAPSRR